MKKLSLLAVLFAFGCGTSEPEPEGPAAKPAPGEGRDQQVAALRAQIAAKNAELRQAEIDHTKIVAERLELDGKPASEAKTTRLAELAKHESDIKVKKQALEAEIADLERRAQGQGTAGAPKPKSADEALDLALDADDKSKKEDEAKRLARAAAEAGADKKRLEEAEKARAAEAAARDKEKIQAGAGARGGEGLTFEERWADAILRVRVELQRFKRW